MKVSVEVLISVLLSTLLGLAITFIGLFQYQKLHTAEIYKENISFIKRDIQLLDNSLSVWFENINSFYEKKETNLSDSILNETNLIIAVLNDIQALAISVDETLIVEDVNAIKTPVNNIQKDISFLLGTNEKNKWNSVISQSSLNTDEIINLTDKTNQDLIKLEESALKRYENNKRNLIIYMIVSVLVYLASCFSLWRWLTLSFVRPLSQLTDSISERAECFRNDFDVFTEECVLKNVPKEILALNDCFSEFADMLETNVADAKRSQRFTKIIMNTAPISIISLDSSGKILLSNHFFNERFFGDEEIQIAEKPQATLDKILPKADHKSLLEQEMFCGEFTASDCNNQRFPVELYANARIFDGEKHFVIVFWDISQRKQKQNELEQAKLQLVQSDKMASVGQLAAGVAHEINNPMGFISSNLTSLSDYFDDYSELIALYSEINEHFENTDFVKEQLNKIKSFEEEIDLSFLQEDLKSLLSESISGAKRVREIVADLSEFSHVNSPNLVEINVNELIDKTISVAWNELKYKAEIVKNYSNVPDIKGYGGKLSQVFLNILINAAQSMETKGTIEITTRTLDKDKVAIDIKDSGCGIPENIIKKIFDPFFTTKDVGEGTGLGLHMVNTIVKNHKGKLDVVSAVGIGSTFTIELLCDPGIEDTPPEKENASGTGDTGKAA